MTLRTIRGGVVYMPHNAVMGAEFIDPMERNRLRVINCMRSNEKMLVVWTCPEKHPCMSGFLPPMASTLQFCRAVTGWDGEHETYCGAKMQVCYDERPKPEGPLTEAASDDEKRIRVADGIREAQKNLREGEMMASEIVAQLGVALKGIRGKVSK